MQRQKATKFLRDLQDAHEVVDAFICTRATANGAEVEVRIDTIDDLTFEMTKEPEMPSNLAQLR